MQPLSPPMLLVGYVWTRPAAPPPGLASVPASILTISDCIMDDLPRPEFWDWFLSVEDAVAARRPNDSGEMQVVAVAMTETDADRLVDELDGGEMPYVELLNSRVPARGELLGYEVVGAEDTLDFHSWHCHGYADEVSHDLDIQVNEHGLLASYEDAVSVLDWMLARPADQAPAPVPWAVVGLLRTASLSALS